jgi:hypothetical protein
MHPTRVERWYESVRPPGSASGTSLRAVAVLRRIVEKRLSSAEDETVRQVAVAVAVADWLILAGCANRRDACL